METISYAYEGALYVNLTNRCDCACVFCLRHNGHKGSIYADDLWLDHEPSREEALAVVDAVKYAPVGHRGFCPITRAASYGMAMSGDEYTRLANEQTCIILMTETKKGLEALDDILAIPEVDGISIGPSDVSASYGLPGQPDHPVVKAAIEEGQRKISASGKALVAQAYTPEAAERMRARGATVMTVGSDVQMIRWRLDAMMRDIRALERECFGGEEEQA